MPNRLLREGITTSDKLDSLSTEAEIFYYRLLVAVDDYGRVDARPLVLIAKCFPLRVGRVKPAHIAAWLEELAKARLVVLYQNDGKPLLEMTNFDPPRAQKSKCPGPLENGSSRGHVFASANICEQPLANVPYSYSDSSTTEFDVGPARQPANPATPVAPVRGVLVLEEWPTGLQWIPPIVERVTARFDCPYGSADDWLVPARWRALEAQVDSWGRGLGQRFADEMEAVFAEFQAYWTERKSKRKDPWRTWLNATKRWHDRQLGTALRLEREPKKQPVRREA